MAPTQWTQRQRLGSASAAAMLCAGLLLCLGAAGAGARIAFNEPALEQWANGYFEPRIAAKVLSGASVGVLQDGEVVFLRGYGWEDPERKIPLDPQRTRIRMCSVSKTFTATALLQLRDQGFIESLDDPVNRYLKRFALPTPHGPDVTLRQLMTHSSGMAGHFTPQGTKVTLPVPVSHEIVAQMFEENIERPPGTIGQYANLGVALESIVIEDITAMSFAEYIDKNIFTPLKMTDAIVHHDRTLPERLAQPYARFPNGETQPVRFFPKHPLTAASGGVIATPADMLRYAALHADVDDPAYGPVLSSASRQEMQRRQFGNHPADPGIGLHFYPDRYGSERFVSHGCGLPGTRSLLGLFPDSNAAIVISVLGGSATPSLGDLLAKPFGRGRLVPAATEKSLSGAPWSEFLTRFAEPRTLPEVPAETAAGAVENIERLPGSYWTERRSLNSFATLFAAGSVIRVEALEAGALSINGQRAVPMGPGVFDTDSARRFIFREPFAGSDIYLHSGPSNAWRQVRGWNDPTRALSALLIGLGLLCTIVLVPLWPTQSRTQRLLKGSGWLLLGLLVALPLMLFFGYRDIDDIASIDAFNGDTARLEGAIAMLRAIWACGFAFLLGAVLVWFRPANGWWRLHLSILGLAFVLMVPGFLLFQLIPLP